MSLRTFPPEMSSTPGTDEKTPLMRSISTSSGVLNGGMISHLQHPTEGLQRPQPTQIQTQSSFFPLACVLTTVVLERVTYYGILANLLIFLMNDTEFKPSESVGLVFVFTSMAWMMSTVGGIVGDSYSGRYNAVWGSLLIYIVGVGAIFGSTFFSKGSRNCDLDCKVLVGSALIVISIGEGAYKANVTAFGGDQLRGQNDNRYRKFFNWFYWCINLGSFLGFSLIAYVEQVFTFTWGFGCLWGCIVLAAVVFCFCKSRYISCPPTGHILKKMYNIIKEAKRKRKEESTRVRNNEIEHYYPDLEKYLPRKSWLDRAMMKYGGSFLDTDVEEVKTILKIMVIFAILIPYWVIYFQMNSTFLLQGIHMKIGFHKDKDAGEDHAVIPPASLSLANVLFVLILIPFMDKIVYPWLDRKGWTLSIFNRILIGMSFAVASMIVAGGVETARLEDSHDCKNQSIDNVNYTACLEIYYQIPQYALIGISEVFASVGALEFAYKEAPKSAQSFVMGLFYFSQSLGSLLGGGLYELCSLGKHSWTPSKTETGKMVLKDHLNYFFFLLAGLQLVTLFVFLAVTVKYRPIQFNQKRTIPVIRTSKAEPHSSLRT